MAGAPDKGMTQYMNHSIDLMEGLARDSGNRINLNRRGYLFASAEDRAGRVADRDGEARPKGHGAGPVRVHDSAADTYVPSPQSGFDFPLTGADIITDASLIRSHFPYLAAPRPRSSPTPAARAGSAPSNSAC